jgi:microcompartment protein CcmK/EutM
VAPLAGAVAVAALIGSGAGGVALLNDGDGASRPSTAARGPVDAVAGPAVAPFRLPVPNGWAVREKARPGWDGQTPMVSLRRGDGTGSVRLRVSGKLEPSLGQLRSVLRSQIPARVDGARVVTSREVQLGGGKALLTLWIDPRSAQVQSNLVVPAGPRSYVLDAAVAPGADDTAREVGSIFSAFRSRGG